MQFALTAVMCVLCAVIPVPEIKGQEKAEGEGSCCGLRGEVVPAGVGAALPWPWPPYEWPGAVSGTQREGPAPRQPRRPTLAGVTHAVL